VSQIKNLINSASREIKLAKEMREEAYAWSNNAATLGSLSNAEEKEFLALNKLDEATAILMKSNRPEPIKTERKVLVDLGGVLAQQSPIRLKP
jgi:predicted phosphatase